MVKPLRNELEKCSSSANQFRLKILSALCQMQSVMGVVDLGYFYYKFLQNKQGTVVLSCVNDIKVSHKQSRYATPKIIPTFRFPRTESQKCVAAELSMGSAAEDPTEIVAHQRRQHHQ